MIEVHDIKKSFGPVQAVKHVSLTIQTGELFGLIGPDGAGKTTLIRILASLLLPDAGSARVAGLDVVRDFRALRQKLGYMPGRFSLYQDLTVQENLEFFAHVFGTTLHEHYDLIEDIYVRLEPFKNRRAGALSGGMKQKLALCCALIHQPDVLFLDEPTTGVDPVSRQEFWDMLGRLRRFGMTTLVSTPYMDEASRCDRIALLHQGALLAVNTPAGLVQAFDWPLFAVAATDRYRLLHDLPDIPGTHRAYAFGETNHLSLLPGPAPTPEALRGWLEQRGHRDVAVRPAAATVEDCFIHLLAS